MLVCNYNPHKTVIKSCLEYISKLIDSLSTKYDNIHILDNFNSGPTDEAMTTTFCQIHNFKNLTNEPSCFKNPNNLTFIDLIMTNRSKSFRNLITFGTGLSCFHKMTLTVLPSWQKTCSKLGIQTLEQGVK